MSDNTGGDVAYPATYNFNPTGVSTNKMSISFVYHQAADRRQRRRLRLPNSDSYGYSHSDSYSHSDAYGHIRQLYCYAKADAHAAIPAHAQTASHTAPPGVSYRRSVFRGGTSSRTRQSKRLQQRASERMGVRGIIRCQCCHRRAEIILDRIALLD